MWTRIHNTGGCTGTQSIFSSCYSPVCDGLLVCVVDLFLRTLSAHSCQPSQTTRPGGHHHFSSRFWHCTHIRPLSQFLKGGQGAVLPPTFCPRRLYSDSATCLKKTKTEINDQVLKVPSSLRVVTLQRSWLCHQLLYVLKIFTLNLIFKPF